VTGHLQWPCQFFPSNTSRLLSLHVAIIYKLSDSSPLDNRWGYSFDTLLLAIESIRQRQEAAQGRLHPALTTPELLSAALPTPSANDLHPTSEPFSDAFVNISTLYESHLRHGPYKTSNSV
jgi:hypothetical protein